MRSGRATVDAPRKNDDPERTRDQKRRSNSSANADPEPIGDRTRTEEPGLATNRLKANSSARASPRLARELTNAKPSRAAFVTRHLGLRALRLSPEPIEPSGPNQPVDST